MPALVSPTTERAAALPIEQRRWWWEGFISDLYSPPVVALPINGLAAWLAGGGRSWWFALLHYALGALVPLAYIVWLHRTGRIDDLHLPNRRDRIGPFVVSVLGAVVAIAAFLWAGAPAILVAIAAGGLLQNSTLMAITTTWQISVHTAAAAALATLAGMGLGPSQGLVLALLLVAVGWARVRLGRHTAIQVVGGALVGALAVLAVTRGVLW